MPPASSKKANLTWAICLFLVLSTLLAYWSVFSSGFVYYDDPFYVFQNPHVLAGLNWRNVSWAFTTRACDNWHPLTWLSLMLDSSVYGANPAGYHATNLILHVLNSILLFLLLQRMTGTTWRSGFVAALFALHPLHVESVAWVAERKDVLSTLFGLLTIGAYVRYVKKPDPAHYCPVLVLFALGLMAKPMLVTLPFVLLLLDFWPLRRVPPTLNISGKEIQVAEANEPTSFGSVSLRRLVWEKVPLLALSVISSVLTIWAQAHAIVLAIPFEFRVLNAALSYARYMERMVWPVKLYVNYPYPQGWPIWYPILAALIIGWLSVIAVRQARPRPYVFTGWFWFLGTLVPVIGLVQVGMQSIADRYTYVPLIGLFIIVAWLSCDLAQEGKIPPFLLRGAGIAAIAVCIPLTIIQAGYWKSSFTLFEHALRLNPNNFLVEENLAMSYEATGQLQPALEHLLRAAKIDPYFGETYNKIGWIQLQLGKYQDAVESFQTGLNHHAAAALAHFGLALAFEKQGKLDEAKEQIQAAMALESGNSEDNAVYQRILQEQTEREKKQPMSPSQP